ncbi:heavy-metal-associated domain-containing protein [[Clostridium] aminophilum]|uniref:Copper chaperone CopZ n=1 Tax=[Clostridium] aminophilum TaxID=1526 RepID=A0A1I6ICT2_9FIRM|nr:hypothetical protein [[Clostridium] aminophilum]SFR64585.1 Copper chaperone CopZ [[Clostridium] aminophilum]
MVNLNIPINQTDAVVLTVLGGMFLLGVRALVGFFRDPAKKRQLADEKVRNGTEILDDRSKEPVDGRIVLSIDGMQCGMCELHMKDAVRKAIPGASGVEASHMKGEVSFILRDPEVICEISTKLHHEIDPLGYRILEMERKKIS